VTSRFSWTPPPQKRSCNRAEFLEPHGQRTGHRSSSYHGCPLGLTTRGSRASLNDMTAKPIEPGAYVLATKYGDGDPQDQWCVGFYKETYDHFGKPRHIVVDDLGQSFRANGFRRVKRISFERGRWILANLKMIQISPHSVWHFARCSMKTNL
jgi:hypothetical protein